MIRIISMPGPGSVFRIRIRIQGVLDTDPYIRIRIQNTDEKNQSRTVAGCGNSSLSADLEKVGWWNVTNIDISTVVLHNMKNQDQASQTYLAMDMTNMPFRDQSFDIVIEKAGISFTNWAQCLTKSVAEAIKLFNQRNGKK